MPRGPLMYRRSQKILATLGAPPAIGTVVTAPLSLGLVGFWARASTISGCCGLGCVATGYLAPATPSALSTRTGDAGDVDAAPAIVRSDASLPMGTEPSPTFALVVCVDGPKAPTTTTAMPPSTHAAAITANARSRLLMDRLIR